MRKVESKSKKMQQQEQVSTRKHSLMQEVRYGTKRDRWLVGLIAVALVLPPFFAFSLLVVQFIQSSFSPSIEIAVVVVLAAWLFLLLSLFPSYSEITPATLHIRSGIFHSNIPLSAIERACLARFSPHTVWSFDQVQIDYRKNNSSFLYHAYAAPKYKAGFLRTLREYAPHIETQD
jgi:hypothetical protein